MDISKLAIFLDAVQIGSMKKAAEKYNYTQTGMLYLVNSVEQELGIHVTSRGHRGIRWNQDGKELEPYFKRLVELDRDMTDKITTLSESKSRNLTIGAYPSIASIILPQVITGFLSQRPEVNATLRMGSQELLQWLESGEIDMAVMRMDPAAEKDYEWTPLMQLQSYAAIPRVMVDKPYESIRLEEFLAFPFLYSTSNPINERINELTNGQPASKIQVSTLDGMGTLRLVSQGLGATSITSLYKNVCPNEVLMVPFEPPIVHSYYIVRKLCRRVKPLADAFVRELQTHCREYYPDEGGEEG